MCLKGLTYMKLKCNICGNQLRKVRDFIRQSGYKFYYECPVCWEIEKRKIKVDK